MPRVVEPLTRKVGPLGMKTSKGRRLNEKSKFENEHTQKFIGEELLEWHVENASAATLSKITARSHQPNAAQQTPTNSDTSKSTPLHAVSRVDQVHELAWQNFSSLSRHALALDTRFLKDPNEKKLQSDHATKCYEDFIRTLVLRGSTPCLVATTVATVPSQNSIVGLASLGIDVKTYCLGDSYTLQKVTDPNICVSHINIVAKETTGASSIPNTMTAEISWMLFGAFGT